MIPQQHTFDTDYPVGAVHCYSAVLNGELVLFDTGPPTAAARAELKKSIDLSQLRHVVITHCHIDHYGLAHWLEEHTEATVYLPYRDSLKIAHHEERLAALARQLEGFGFDADYLNDLRAILDSGMVFPSFPERFRIVEHDLPSRLGVEVLSCAGHSQSDLVLSGPDWAVTGDVLLRGIFQSPLLDIDLETGQRFRNYEAYCSSIGRLASLRGKTILPGHRESIDSLDAGILFYVGKLFERVRLYLDLKAEGSVAEAVDRLCAGQSQHPFHAFLKASEIVFMRDFLAEPQRLKRALERVGLFEAVAAGYAGLVGV